MSKKKTFATVQHQESYTQVRFEVDRLIETRELVELRECLQQAAEAGSGRNLLLDCSQVQSVSTGTLAMLLKFQRQLFENGTRLKLYGLGLGKLVPASTDSYSHELFRVFNLDRFFDVCEESQMSFEQCASALSAHASRRHSDSSVHQPVSC
ncbi:MAG: STAS domain-containing protein [Phycisphaerae bacterium]|nr:STAS domain-containing protein [Phycisphaerae bacterium]